MDRLLPHADRQYPTSRPNFPTPTACKHNPQALHKGLEDSPFENALTLGIFTTPGANLFVADKIDDLRRFYVSVGEFENRKGLQLRRGSNKEGFTICSAQLGGDDDNTIAEIEFANPIWGRDAMGVQGPQAFMKGIGIRYFWIFVASSRTRERFEWRRDRSWPRLLADKVLHRPCRLNLVRTSTNSTIAQYTSSELPGQAGSLEYRPNEKIGAEAEYMALLSLLITVEEKRD